MLWKSTTKVAFGIKNEYVIAWYCDEVGNSPSAPTNDLMFKANVGDPCLVFDDTAATEDLRRA
jgi:hypothetical protein